MMLKTLLAASAALLASAAGPASAEGPRSGMAVESGRLILHVDYRPWVFAPSGYVELGPIYAPGLSPRQVRGLLRDQGFGSVKVLRRAGGTYRVRAVDPHGNRVALTLSAYDGGILRARLLADEPRERGRRVARLQERRERGDRPQRRIAEAQAPRVAEAQPARVPERLPAARPDAEASTRVAALEEDRAPPRDAATSAPAGIPDETGGAAEDTSAAVEGEAEGDAEAEVVDEVPADGAEAPAATTEGPADGRRVVDRAVRVIPLDQSAPKTLRPVGPSSAGEEPPAEATDETTVAALPDAADDAPDAAAQDETGGEEKAPLPLAMRQAEVLVEPPATAPLPRPRPERGEDTSAVAAPVEGETQESDPLGAVGD